MPNASGWITASDVVRMRELRELDFTNTQIARLTGCGRHAVYRHLGRSKRPDAPTDEQRLRCARLKDRAHRYSAFVEKAARFGAPLLVPPTPF